MFKQAIVVCGLLAMVPGCSGQPSESQPEPSSSVVLFEGARLIPGDGGSPIEESALLTDDGTITTVGLRGELSAPTGAARIDLTGKTIMPLLIDTHVHPGFQKGLALASENFSRETIISDLDRALYFGVGAVMSQGIERADLADQIRSEQEAGTTGGARLRIAGRGIGAPNAGVDGFAHLVRDLEMNDSLVAAIVERGVYVMGNMSSPKRSTYAELPSWLRDGDPLFRLVQETVWPEVVSRMRGSFVDRDTSSVADRQKSYEILERSLAKLNAAGARIILGADTGLQDHFFGLAAHQELEAMVQAGMTPAEGIVAATSRGAEYLRLDTMGSLAPGRSADFLVLDANPLDDITNTRRIDSIYVAGAEVDRATLREKLQAKLPTE